MKSVVFEFRIPDVLTVRVTGSNENRYARYRKRIDDPNSQLDETAKAAAAEVEYESSQAGHWT